MCKNKESGLKTFFGTESLSRNVNERIFSFRPARVEYYPGCGQLGCL